MTGFYISHIKSLGYVARKLVRYPLRQSVSYFPRKCGPYF